MSIKETFLYWKVVSNDHQMKITLCPWSCVHTLSLELSSLELPLLPSASFQSLSEPPPMGPGTGIAAFLDISFNIMKVFLDSLTHLEKYRLTSWNRSSHQEQPRWWQLLQTPSDERNKVKYFKIVSLLWCYTCSLRLGIFFLSWQELLSVRLHSAIVASRMSLLQIFS